MNGLVKPFVPNSHKSSGRLLSYNESGRYTYTWNNSADIPLVGSPEPWPGTQPVTRRNSGWPGDFLEHYRLAPDGTRSYSASAFESADSVLIVK